MFRGQYRQTRSAAKAFQRSYWKLFKLAGIQKPDGTPKRCHPHMFRDTFAVENVQNSLWARRDQSCETPYFLTSLSVGGRMGTQNGACGFAGSIEEKDEG